MKIIHEFTLPEDKEDEQLHRQAVAMHIAIHDFYTWLRAKKKYEDAESVNIEELWNKYLELFSEFT